MNGVETCRGVRKRDLDPFATRGKMASQKQSRAAALKDLRLAREGGGRANQYKVCLVATVLNVVAS